jgi:hypothetical protein
VCGGVGGVGVWGLNEQSRPTPYVRHSTDCTCCDFGHLRFSILELSIPKIFQNYSRIIRELDK